MKAISLPVIAASLALAMPAFADEKPDARMMQQMQGNLATMQKQLERFGKAKTTEERQKIWAEHMQTMQQNMFIARDMHYGMADCPMMQGGMGMMGGPGMMGGGGGWGMMGPGMMGPGYYGGRSGGYDATDRRMEMMERRLDMMQQMMQGGMPMMQPGGPGRPSN